MRACGPIAHRVGDRIGRARRQRHGLIQVPVARRGKFLGLVGHPVEFPTQSIGPPIAGGEAAVCHHVGP